MKRLVALLLCAFSFLAAPIRAEVELSFDFYHEQLSPLGEWAEVDGYGYVWHPTGVDEDWAPYTDGYWSYTDAGWTWVSYEDWGSICYHYGRWTLLDDYGWCWVPGYEWGPAWVSWRNNEDYVGWAPLPPEVEWVEDRGISVWVDAHYEIGPRYFNFCRIRDFGAPVLRHVLLPRVRNVEFCFSTVNITNISYNRDYGCVYNGGFDYDFITARVDRPVPAFKLVQNTTVNVTNNIFVNSPRGNALVVNTPRRAANYNTPTRRPEVRRAFKRDAVKRGWSGLENPATRDRLLGKMREESKGLSPTNAPARPVRREALAAVPEKADFTARPKGMRRLPADRNARANGEEENRAGRSRGESGAETAGSEAGRAGAPGRGSSARERATAETPTPAGSRGGLRTRPGSEDADEKPGTPRVGGRTPVAEKPGNGRAGMGAGRERTVETAEENAATRPGRGGNNGNDEDGGRENAGRAKAARDDAERGSRQRQTTENTERATEMKRQAEQQENTARENSQRARAAEAAASRRNQVQEAESAKRANVEKLQRAKEQQAEATQRGAAQRQAESQREMQRAGAAQQQQQARAQAAAAARERAVQSQRQQAPDRDRGQAAAAAQARAQAQAQQQARAQAQAQQQQRAAQAQQQQRAQAQMQQRAQAQAQAQAQQRSQVQAQAQAQAQQRAAAEAAARRPEGRSQGNAPGNRGNRRGQRDE